MNANPRLPYRTLLVYIVTRLVGLAPLLLPGGEETLVGLTSSHQAFETLRSAQALREYPWLMAALLELPMRLGAITQFGYIGAWLQAALILDALFVSLLWRASEGRMTPGLQLWLLLPPALGPLLYAMFDLFPAVAAAAALLAIAQARHRWGGAMLGMATAVKLWPMAGLAALLLPLTKRERLGTLCVFLSIGLFMVIATLIAGGPERLLSPLLWQYRRGLQVESLTALPFLWMRHLSGASRWTTLDGPFNCFEVLGPGVDVALLLNSLAALVGAVAVAILHWHAFRLPPALRTPAFAAQLFLTAVLAVIITNKVFSPQYMIWIAAPLAALGVIGNGTLMRVEIIVFLAACALTQVIFPFHYDGLVLEGYTKTWVLAALTLRDLLLVVLVLRLGAQLARLRV